MLDLFNPVPRHEIDKILRRSTPTVRHSMDKGVPVENPTRKTQAERAKERQEIIVDTIKTYGRWMTPRVVSFHAGIPNMATIFRDLPTLVLEGRIIRRPSKDPTSDYEYGIEGITT